MPFWMEYCVMICDAAVKVTNVLEVSPEEVDGYVFGSLNCISCVDAKCEVGLSSFPCTVKGSLNMTEMVLQYSVSDSRCFGWNLETPPTQQIPSST